MLAKFRVVLARFFVERHLMISEPSFELRGRQTYIGFGFIGSRHLGLVDDPFSEAMSFQGAFFFLLTVACSFGLILCRLCRVLKNRLIMSLNNSLYVRHATVAQFESVSVEYFLQFVASREAFIDKAQKLSSYLGFDVLVVRRIEPDNFPGSVTSLGRCILWWFKLQLVCISTLVQRVLVRSCSFVKHGFVG